MEYRRNEDKWPIRDVPLYNAVLDVETVEVGAEPVSIAEAKSHLGITFSEKDGVISGFITAARKAAEKYTGLSLLTKTVTATLNNSAGGIEIPYGPVLSVTSVYDSEGVIVSDHSTQGSLFKTLTTPESDYVKIVYTAGYATCPQEIKQAILFEVEAMMRTQENENVDGIKKLAKSLLQPHRRQGWLL